MEVVKEFVSARFAAQEGMCRLCVLGKDGGSLTMGVLARDLMSVDWVPDRDPGILNGQCYCGIAVGNIERESAFGERWFVTETLDRFAVGCEDVWELLRVLKLGIMTGHVGLDALESWEWDFFISKVLLIYSDIEFHSILCTSIL